MLPVRDAERLPSRVGPLFRPIVGDRCVPQRSGPFFESTDHSYADGDRRLICGDGAKRASECVAPVGNSSVDFITEAANWGGLSHYAT